MRPLTELCKLSRKYGSDRGGVMVPFPNMRRDCYHDYTPIYSDIFEHIRGDIMRVAEFGIWEGRGLRMWAEYFGNAQIDGFDIAHHKLIQENRIKTYWCDQNNPDTINAAWEAAGRNWHYDLIIDDGGHEYQHHVNTLKVMLPRLRCGGWYIIEDNIGFPDVSKEVDILSGHTLEVVRWPENPVSMMQIIQRPGAKWDPPPLKPADPVRFSKVYIT